MAENELSPPVLGVSWDGTGYGTDQTIWGGEFLKVEDRGFRRFAHFRTFPLPGGDAAIREPRRAALGLLFEMFGEGLWDKPVPFLRDAFENSELKTLRRMLERNLNCPRTSSVGRLFDGVAALTGLRTRVSFEGQAAMELEARLDRSCSGLSYPLPVIEKPDLDPTGPRAAAPEVDDGSITSGSGTRFVVDWESMLLEILSDCRRQAAIGEIVAKFHSGLCSSMVDVAKLCCLDHVVLSGGCFQNRHLLEGGVSRLRTEGFLPYWHQLVPPNDGGIALGQVMAAARRKG
jgi:hydrogenase maturation protein HypF